MSIFVFVGPTLGVEEARTILDATYLPPASQGDVFRLVATHDARIVGIIDGHFQEVPSVWHKELLWAMSQGIHVLGAASMGALRAAELAAFGMVGEGRISKPIAPAFWSRMTRRSRTMMRSRWSTASRARLWPVVGRARRHSLHPRPCVAREGDLGRAPGPARGLGKSCFYTERNYEALLDLAFRDGWPAPELKRLRDWLPRGRISQKMEDARAMLARIQTGDFGDRKQVTFDFHHTTVWDRLTVEALEQQPVFAESGLTGDEQAVLAEARLLPDEYLKAKEQAERVLRIGPCPPVRCVALAMLDVLRQEGSYAGLAARAGRKASWLSAAQMPRASDLTGLQALQLFEWYFGRRLAHDIPNNVEGFGKA